MRSHPIENKEWVMQLTDEAKLLSHCAPIFFLPTESPAPDTIHANGTVALIDTGQKKVLVTCAHVWTEFEDYRLQHPSGRLATIFVKGYGLPEVVTDDSLLALDRDLDLAVFEARAQNWKMGSKEFCRITTWPLRRAKPGDPLAFLGFTGQARHTTRNMGWFNYSFFGLSVSDSSDRKLLIDKRRDGRGLLNNEGVPVPAIEMGGMSGSPAYVRDRLGGFRLAGFVQMGETSDDKIFLIHACFLQPDGTLG